MCLQQLWHLEPVSKPPFCCQKASDNNCLITAGHLSPSWYWMVTGSTLSCNSPAQAAGRRNQKGTDGAVPISQIYLDTAVGRSKRVQ